MRVQHFSLVPRRGRSVVHTMLAMVTLAACATDTSTAPTVSTAVVSSVSPAKSGLDAFVEAQGTFCSDAAGLPCADLTTYDVGYILNWCGNAICAEGTYATTDIGGVNARWWQRRGLPALPAYNYSGAVNESLTKDGRRRLVITVRARNTFVAMYDLIDFAPLVGADFFEYPLNASPGITPSLGTVTLSADITLPAGYEGMPDLVQVFLDPDVFFDINRFVVTSTTTGRLSRDTNGIVAGTTVVVDGDFHIVVGRKYSDQRAKVFRNSRSVGLSGATRIVVRPVN